MIIMEPPIFLFVRHCAVSNNSKNKIRPSWFSKEKALINLLNTKDDNTHITVILDTASTDNPDNYFSYKYEKVKTVQLKGGTDAHSFINLLEYIDKLDNIPDNAIVYLLEDDYIHVSGWTRIMREGFRLNVADYITLYDHPDKYDRTIYSNLPSTLYVSDSCHWRSTPSTTNTYALLFSTLKKQKDIHAKFSDKNKGYTFDHDKFMYLNSLGYKLISCIPGYSTHVETEYLSPFIKWTLKVL